MRSINVWATQRISADERAKIETSDPAIRLIDAGGWFDGEIRETWTAFAAARYLPPGATGLGKPRGARPPPRRGRSDHRRLAVSSRSTRQGTAAQMVSSTPGRRQQPARQRSVGQRYRGDDLPRRSEFAANRRICN